MTDFDQAIIQAAEHFRAQGLRPALIEKDYYVTEVLRIIAAAIGDKVIFKGGTSLSKGWNLIERFSEDIDLLFRMEQDGEALGKKNRHQRFKNAEEIIIGTHGFTQIPAH